MSARGRWIAVYDPGLRDRATGQPRVRFLERGGYKVRRGMYRQQRVVRIEYPVLTDDFDRAYRFRGPAEALEHLSRFYPKASILKTWRMVRLDDEASR